MPSQLPSMCVPPPLPPAAIAARRRCVLRRDEGTFELSLSAEALHEALVRDAGTAIVAELYAHR